MLAVALLCFAGAAQAGVVSGKLDLPEAPARPARSKGFLKRIHNPILPLQKPDPKARIIVALVGGPAAPAAPGQTIWEVLGDSFSRPVLAVRLGGEVTIRNKGPRALALTVADKPDLLSKGPVNPGASKSMKPSSAGLFTVTDPELPHLIGRVIVLDNPYFAVPDGNGKFEIKDVPAGEWTLRVFYADGWIDRTDDKVSVGTGRSAVTVTPRIPANYPRKAGG